MTVFRKVFEKEKKNQCDLVQNPCNAGECIPSETDNRYTCQCPDGITGTRCTEGQYFVDNGANDAQYEHPTSLCHGANQNGQLLYFHNGKRITLSYRLKLDGISRFNTIISAKLFLTSKTNSAGFSYDIKIKAMKRADSTTDIEQCDFVDDALRTNTQVIWSGSHPAVAIGDVIETPDISAVLNEVISINGWRAGSHVDIVFFNDELPNQSTNPKYVLYTGLNGGATKPKLLVTFT